MNLGQRKPFCFSVSADSHLCAELHKKIKVHLVSDCHCKSIIYVCKTSVRPNYFSNKPDLKLK